MKKKKSNLKKNSKPALIHADAPTKQSDYQVRVEVAEDREVVECGAVQAPAQVGQVGRAPLDNINFKPKI